MSPEASKIDPKGLQTNGDLHCLGKVLNLSRKKIVSVPPRFKGCIALLSLDANALQNLKFLNISASEWGAFL